MPNKPGNDDRTFAGNDRERDREVSSEPNRSNSAGTRQRSARGFASMDRSKQKEIASKGGRAAHAKGTAHEFDSGEAREAGRKGGMAVSRNREHMAAIGRRGGEARGHSRSRAGAQTNTQGAQGSSEGAVQNSRASIGDREVNLPGQSASNAGSTGNTGNATNASNNGANNANATTPQGGRSNSIGGESRTGGSNNESNPNH